MAENRILWNVFTPMEAIVKSKVVPQMGSISTNQYPGLFCHVKKTTWEAQGVDILEFVEVCDDSMRWIISVNDIFFKCKCSCIQTG